MVAALVNVVWSAIVSVSSPDVNMCIVPEVPQYLPTQLVPQTFSSLAAPKMWTPSDWIAAPNPTSMQVETYAPSHCGIELC